MAKKPKDPRPRYWLANPGVSVMLVPTDSGEDPYTRDDICLCFSEESAVFMPGDSISSTGLAGTNLQLAQAGKYSGFILDAESYPDVAYAWINHRKLKEI